MTKNIEVILWDTQKKILNVYKETFDNFSTKLSQELELIRHEADELRNNRNRSWSERTAAEMIYVAASEHLGL